MDTYSIRFVCITRPRRFGKSINAMMLASYYTNNLDTKDVFDKLNVSRCSSYENHINKHNVIYISFNTGNDVFRTYEEYKKHFVDRLISDIKEYCPEVNPNDLLSEMLDTAYEKTDKGFIFIIDEWDYIFNNDLYTKDDRRNFLRFLEGLLKDKSYVELAYMTGILPIAKYSSGSSLNMFKEYDAIGDIVYSKYFGFLQEEVEQLCKKQDAVTMDELKDWYDGYYTKDGDELYNPRSVVCALEDSQCTNYWTNTGKKKELLEYINLNVDGLKQDILDMLAGNTIEMALGGYDAESKADIDSRNLALSAMTILGFLSYYDYELKIPNRELMMEFREMIATSDESAFKEVIKNSNDVLQATLDQNEEKLASLIEETHNIYNSYFEYNTENALSCVVAVAYIAAKNKYVIKREDVGATGRADFSFYPLRRTNAAFIIELKKNDTPENAIEQIKERKYFLNLKNFTGKKLLVGITYDVNEKKHSAKIEEIQ